MITLLDIVFQSGEFINPDNSWVTDLLVTIVGAAIGAGATIIALYFTFKHDKRKEEERRIQFQIEKVRYFQSLIKNVQKGLVSQIDNLKVFADTVKANPLEIPLLTQNPQNDIQRVVHKLNQEEYFHAYLGQLNDSPESIEEFRKLYAMLDFFDASINNITDSLKNSVQFDYERKLKVKKLVEDAMDDAASFLVNPSFVQQVDMLKFINQIIEDAHKNKTDTSDIKYFHDNFVHPLKVGLINYGRTFPEILTLLRQLKNATYIYTEIQMQNNFVADNFQVQHDYLKKQLDEFTKVSKRLTEYKNKTLMTQQ